MKTVFRNAEEVAHIWASQTQSEGRCSNAFFRDSMLFSYGTHYCVGMLFGKDRVALNLRESSATTAKHQRVARGATSHLKQIFVLDPAGVPDRETTKSYIQYEVEEAAKAKPDGRRSHFLVKALKMHEDYNLFCDWTDHPELKLPAPVYDDATLARLRKEQKEENAKERARERAREAELALSQAERIARWRLGEGYSLPYGVATMLRVNHHAQVVETSHSARIPVEDAKRLWPLIRRTMKGERDYEVGMPLGSYQLTKINRDGSIVVGCHSIPYPEIEAVAVTLGLLEMADG